MTLTECLPNLGKDLLEEIEEHAIAKSFLTGEYIVKEGQVVRFLPMVIDGSVKVFSQEESLQFLLYYISPGGTCIFSFAHLFHEDYLEFSATAETDSELLLLPIHKVREWYEKYPRFVDIILGAYQRHYKDLLQTTKQVICHNLEERLFNYFRKKVAIQKTDLLTISHQDIANDLGSSREVITRLMKKLESNGLTKQMGRKIKVL